MIQDKFPEISAEDYQIVMRQVERQYNVRRHRLYKTYFTIGKHPSDIAPEDWQWLIDNLWSNEKFLNRSRQNSQNIAQQEMKSLVRTKSIMQIAYELREPATAETEPERIASVVVPLAEHFALVLGRKPNHSRGASVPGVNQGAQERHRLHAQAEIARQHADNAREHAVALEAEVQRLTQANMQLRDDMQSHREELASQRRSVEAQNADVERLMDQKLEERMNALARITAHNISAPNSTSGNTP
ncbi:hypothetical protein EJB05_45464, partial [Eragrostis curvula]